MGHPMGYHHDYNSTLLVPMNQRVLSKLGKATKTRVY